MSETTKGVKDLLKQKLIQLFKDHKKIILFPIVIVLGIVGAFLTADRPSTPSPLEPGETVRIEIDGRKLRVTTPKGTTEQFVPDTAKVTVRDGVANVQVQKIGVKAELGGGFAVTPSRMKLELDSRIAYAWRFSFHAGLTIDPAADRLINVARPLVFVAYPMQFKWTPNTSIWVGRELPGDWCGGFRVRF